MSADAWIRGQGQTLSHTQLRLASGKYETIAAEYIYAYGEA